MNSLVLGLTGKLVEEIGYGSSCHNREIDRQFCLADATKIRRSPHDVIARGHSGRLKDASTGHPSAEVQYGNQLNEKLYLRCAILLRTRR